MSRVHAGRLAAFILASALLAGCLPTGPPAPSVGIIYGGFTFDTCAAPTTTKMATWASQSPYHAVGVYVGGNSAACSPAKGTNPNLTSGWVSTIEDQGWRLLPLYVGSQAPCTSFSSPKIDPNNAPGQGVSEAEDAVAKASALGFGTGSPIYFDMEGYGRDQGCINAVTTFLNYWDARIHQLGYVAGLYSSASSGITDQVTFASSVAGYNPPDELWIARWVSPSGSCSSIPSNLSDPAVPDTMWANHQRHRQFCGNVTPSYGGVAINIDASVSDGMVAGR
jgi:hypothetical protein